MISVLLEKTGHLDWTHWFMNEKFSLLILFGGLAIIYQCVWKERRRIPAPVLNALSFILLSYLTILWQYFSTSYGIVMLLGIVPACDYLFDNTESEITRRWLLFHGALLGLVFSPCEYHIPVTGSFIGLYLLGAALAFKKVSRTILASAGT